MAKKTVKTKAKAKPQAVKTVVKKESVGKVINKPQPGKAANKEKISKILLIASIALVVIAFCVTFAPAFNLEYFGNNDLLLGTGTVSSLFTIIYYFLESSYVFEVGITGDVLEASKKAVYNRQSPFALAMAIVVTLLVLVTIAILILFLTKKYRGKIKLAFSITSWVLLLATVSLIFLSSVLIYRVRTPNEWDGVVQSIKTSLGIAPILCGTFGALSLVTNVTSFALNHK